MKCETGIVLDVLDAAYELGQPADRWLHDLATRLDAALGDGSGTIAMIADLSGTERARFEHISTIGVGPWWRQQVALFEQMPVATMRAFQTGPIYFWSHTAAAVIRHDPATAALLEESGRQTYGAGQLEALEKAKAGDLPDALIERLVFTAMSPFGRGISAIVPRRDVARRAPSRTELAVWGRVAAHIETAYRLRTSDPVAEATLSPSGKVLDASGAARTAVARDALRAAAIAQDRVRARRGRRTSAVEATEQWRAIVGGRWALVDQFERDGRRYLVAKVADDSSTPVGELTKRETQVVELAVRGHTNKLIAYDLGVSQATVVRCLAEAARKLRTRSRVELIQAFLQGRV